MHAVQRQVIQGFTQQSTGPLRAADRCVGEQQSWSGKCRLATFRVPQEWLACWQVHICLESYDNVNLSGLSLRLSLHHPFLPTPGCPRLSTGVPVFYVCSLTP